MSISRPTLAMSLVSIPRVASAAMDSIPARAILIRGTGFKRPRVSVRRAGMFGGYDFMRNPSRARARAAIRGARRLRRRRYNYPSIKAEPKFLDTYKAATAVPSNNTYASLSINPSATVMISTPQVGDSEQNRDGKKIVITQVEVKGVIHKPAQTNQTATDNGEHAWIALVLDTQTNGTACSSADVFKSINSGADTEYAQPFRNLLFGGRFRILKMKKFTFNNPVLSWDGTNMEQSGICRPFKLYKKMRLPVNFNAGTDTSIANVQDNSLHVMAWCSLAQCNIGYQARIRFIG